MGILLTVAVTHPENVPTIDLQYEVIDHYFASDRMSGKRTVTSVLFLDSPDIWHVPPTFFLTNAKQLGGTFFFFKCEHVTCPPERAQLPTDCKTCGTGGCLKAALLRSGAASKSVL